MDIQVRLFAGLRERLGSDLITVAVPNCCTAAQLKAALSTLHPTEKNLLTSALVAVNRQYVTAEQTIQPRDEVALIPPVGGGSMALPSCLITSDELSLDAAQKALSSPSFGGITLFAGTVREWTGGRQTSHLEYEAYTEMAISIMQDIERELASAFPGVQTLQWHRVGKLYPTDIAVICGAAAPHRDDAFAACRALIDRLKKDVPIWKKEWYADGKTVWQANP